jgi:class 3 adenylate cyclase
MDGLSLRFVDPDLERDYQRVAAAEGRNGLRATLGASVVIWLLAALVLPVATELSAVVAIWVPLAMAALSALTLLASRWAVTLDRQHLLISLLTGANGLVIMALALAAGLMRGYAVGAIMLLFTFGFLARTRFVFASLRTAVIVAGFVVIVATYPDPSDLILDSFILIGGAVGSLLALHLLERARRRVFFQRLVIDDQATSLAAEMAKSEGLLLNVLPASVSARLRDGEVTIADTYGSVSVLFADIVGFTPLASQLQAGEVVTMLNRLFSRFDDLVDERGLEKIKTIGDAYMAAGGLPEPMADHAVRVVDLGLAMLDAVRQVDWSHRLDLRIGVHSGPAVGGVIGHRKFAFDLWGDTVNIASRLESHGVNGRVQVSADTARLIGDRFATEPRGSIELRGHGTMQTYLVSGRRGDGPLAAKLQG